MTLDELNDAAFKYSDPPKPQGFPEALTREEIYDLATRMKQKARETREKLRTLEPIAESHTAILALLRASEEQHEAISQRDELIRSLTYLLTEVMDCRDDGPTACSMWVASQLRQPGSGDEWWEKLDEEARHYAIKHWGRIQNEIDAVYPRGLLP